MDRYIGLDAHASSCTLGVLGPGGKRLGSHVVETNAKALIEVLRSIPGPRHLRLEEGTLAGWLYEVLSPHVEEIVVTAVRESRGPKSDKLDAFGVAERLRIGAIKRKVYKERGQFAALGDRVKGARAAGGRCGSGDEPDQGPHAVTRSTGVRDRGVLRHRSLGVDYSSAAGGASRAGAAVPGARDSPRMLPD